MKLFLLDRDGVIIVNRPTNIKTPADIELIDGAATAVGQLTKAGYKVAICTNQSEIARGVMTAQQVQHVHDALKERLAAHGGRIDGVYCCGALAKSPRKKPACGLLREALDAFGADPASTWFVGDQKADLQAAYHARCRGILVRTGMGVKTLERGLPSYLEPIEVYDDLAAAVRAALAR
jgi:D-glycero-D-manno-heptose 1,7-bisphosphate phosphatase